MSSRSRRRASLPGSFATECLLELCQSPELGELMPVYHRLFFLAKEHCHAEGCLQDMKEICQAGLRVYGPTRGPHAARSCIAFALGQCFEAELDLDKAAEVSPVSVLPSRSLPPGFSRFRFHGLCGAGRPTRRPSPTSVPGRRTTTARWCRS
jgi:hypothetical protein